MDDALASSATMNAMTLRPLIAGYLVPYRLLSSEMDTRLRHDCSEASADCGCREVWYAISSMRAVFSARSM